MLKVVSSVQDAMYEEANLLVDIFLAAAELVDAKNTAKY